MQRGPLSDVARVLFLTQVLPYPLDAGPKVRAYYVLRHLSRAHEVTLVSFVRADDSPEAVAHLQRFCHAVHTVPMRRSRLRDARALLVSAFTGQPAVIVRDEIGAMHALLRRLVAESDFDVIHADQTSMAQYALYAAKVSACASQRPALVLDAHNALYRVPERLAAAESNSLKCWLLRREARALRRYEAETYRRFDQVVFVSEEDRALFQIPGSRFIPICVDPDDRPLVQRVPLPRTILHLGTMFWPPNIEGVLWFAREVFPQVRAEVPEARFVIVGKNPPLAVRELADTMPGIEVTGYVPDPTQYLAQTAAFVVPLHAAGGMRVKIVDAWCWGLPIVSTSLGAEGIAVRNEENLLLADTPQAFAQAVVRLLREPELGQRLRENGRRWADEHYNWRRVYGQWDKVYSDLVGCLGYRVTAKSTD